MTKAELLARIASKPLLLDGGLGSLLIAQGLAAGQAPEAWAFEHPDRIVAAHRAYVDAGSDIIHAVTFGGSAPKLAAAGLEGRCREVNKTAVALARKACGPNTLVAGDVGPTGKFLPPMGTAAEADFDAAFAEQCTTLAEAGADLISIETMVDLREALAAVRAAAATGLPVLASMTFDAKKRGFFTIMGDRLVHSLKAMDEAGATVVGFNCSVTSVEMVRMVEEAVAGQDAPVVAQPNAGQPRMTADGVVYDASAERFVADLMAMVKAGARVVGGCCGTVPAFMAQARAALDSAQRS